MRLCVSAAAGMVMCQILTTASLGAAEPSKDAAWMSLEGDGLFKRGDTRMFRLFYRTYGGYAIMRIPALVVTGKGTLLAFCEGRDSGADHGDINMVARRSEDGGKSWGDLTLVYDEGEGKKITIGNPCPVVDQDTGTVFLMFTRDNTDVLLTRSADDGLTWAAPVVLTKDVKESNWGWMATGPGHGIQITRGKHKGRLLIPTDCEDKTVEGGIDAKGHSFVIYSDDHGATWKHGGITGKGMNECQAVELKDGSIMMSMRNYLGHERRAFSVSKDGGETWSTPELNHQVYCSTCQAAILRYSFEPKSVILYSGPARGRSQMTVRVSYDEGRTWPIAKLIYGRQTSYSDMAVLPSGEIGLIMENDDHTAISFMRFSLEDLLN